MYKNSLLISYTLVMVILVSSCKSDENTEIPQPIIKELSVNETEIVTSANDFTFDLMTEIEAEIPNDNYFISSFSVNTALSMVLNGASETSQEEFIEALNLSGMSADAINESYKSLVQYIYGLDPSVTLNVANSNWYSNEYVINSDFASTLTAYYDAEIFESDFGSSATLDALNGWVEDETNGKIKLFYYQIINQ